MGNTGKVVYTIVFLALIGSILLGIWTHAEGFKTAFGSVGSFFVQVMQNLKG